MVATIGGKEVRQKQFSLEQCVAAVRARARNSTTETEFNIVGGDVKELTREERQMRELEGITTSTSYFQHTFLTQIPYYPYSYLIRSYNRKILLILYFI